MKRLLFLFLILLFVIGCSKGPSGAGVVNIEQNIVEDKIVSFKATGDPTCYSNGKPVIRLFATSWCPHCKWIKGTFNKVAKEYVDAGKISAYHWVLDTGDNELTPDIEESVIPPEEIGIFKKYNPDQSIPTFIFACNYHRIGNAYEAQNNLKAEEAEFRAVIDEILSKQ